MKILVAVDGSPQTQRMLAYLAKHDEWFGPRNEYTVIHSVPSIPSGAAHMLSRDDLKSYYEEEAEKVFAPLRGFFDKQGLKANFVPRIGPAEDTISALATQGGYDVILMGSHGHGTFGKLVMGSVATRVMTQCGTPVLLVR